jgi:hypothetical protein
MSSKRFCSDVACIMYSPNPLAPVTRINQPYGNALCDIALIDVKLVMVRFGLQLLLNMRLFSGCHSC